MLNIKPTYIVDGITSELSLEKLKSDGVKALILDLDNTLIITNSGVLKEEILNWLLKAISLDIKMLILTNNKETSYIRKITPIFEKLKIKIISHAKKPCSSYINQAILTLGVNPTEVCLVGDRVLTDMFGAKLANIRSAFVHPLIGKREFFLFRILRKIEKIFLSC